MVYQKKIQKWSASVGIKPDDFWVHADSAPLKEFLSKLLSSEILRTAPDIVVAETIPFEKLLAIAQYKLGIHTCLVGSDLYSTDSNLKLGLFATVISLKSALADYKPEILLQLPSPDFGIAGGSYSNKANCQKCGKRILFIERIIVAERPFHRSCMHCFLCGKRLFLGLLRVVNDHLECFEHFLNKAIVGNELLPFENAKTVKTPPARPPPPKRLTPAVNEEPKISPVEKKAPEKHQTPSKTSGNGGSDNSEDNNWEAVEYPEQLNPFSDEDEIDKLSDNLSSLNPFGDSSDEEESDAEHIERPVPAPRKVKTPPIEEIPPKVVEEEIKKEEVVSGEPAYPDLKKLFVDTESETMFNFYLPSSLVLCRKRLIDLSEFDKPKLIHELDKVIKTLDYIEKSCKETERSLEKQLLKDDFKWEKNALVDEFGKAMKLKHENLLKGSMIVHEYLKRLLQKAISKIDESDVPTNRNLREQLQHLQSKLKYEQSAIPSVMEDELLKFKDQKKQKTLVKRIKKVF